MNDINTFFGKGYKEKPKEDFGVIINVMNDIYKGKDKIEIVAGEIIIDGIRKAKAPITSGTWIKVQKGKKILNNTLTVVKSCGIIERSDN